MKRLFGLIGFTFLFVLSAVFYSDFNEIVFAIIGSLGVLSVAVGIFLIISKKNKSFGKSLCVFAFAVIYSAGNIIGYSEYINNTVINNYSDKEITASGNHYHRFIMQLRNQNRQNQRSAVRCENSNYFIYKC